MSASDFKDSDAQTQTANMNPGSRRHYAQVPRKGEGCGPFCEGQCAREIDEDRDARTRKNDAHSHPSLCEWERWRETIIPHSSDSLTRMNPLMTTFIQIRLIVIMVNN